MIKKIFFKKYCIVLTFDFTFYYATKGLAFSRIKNLFDIKFNCFSNFFLLKDMKLISKINIYS